MTAWPPFQGRYKASRITNEPYLKHITRYIHLNPNNFCDYKYSSYKSYLDFYKKTKIPNWLKPKKILDLFECSDYKKFVESMAINRPSIEFEFNELVDN